MALKSPSSYVEFASVVRCSRLRGTQPRRELDWRATLLLRAKSLHHFLLEVGPVSEGLERRYLPLHYAPSWKRTNEFIHLILRLGSNYKGPGESIACDASRTNLRVLTQALECWNNAFVEQFYRLLPARRCSGLSRLELDQIEHIHG